MAGRETLAKKSALVDRDTCRASGRSEFSHLLFVSPFRAIFFVSFT
jgi:hypothetical protein